MSRHHNGARTAALLAALAGLLMLVGYLIAGPTGLVIGFVIALGTNAFAYFNSARLALRSMNAYPVSEAEQPALYRMVRELSTQAKQPMPSLYLSPTAAPNAFATGRDPRNAAVCCTEGIMKLLDERELRGVIGHELSHVYNRDILISSIAATVASAIMFIAQFAWLIPMGGGGSSRDDRDGNIIGVLLVMILGPIAASMLQLALSRSREYQADASGAELTHDPLALASALRKLERGAQAAPLAPEPQLETTSALMIVNQFKSGGVAKLFSTHPPLPERIARLEEMAGYRN